MLNSSPEAIPPVYAAGFSGQGEGEYAFFTYRRYLWTFHRANGKVQFFLLPETRSSQEPIDSSRVYTVDQDEFPLDQVLFQVSERNLTNYLWILNPVSGKAMFIRARRDGGFDESPVLDVSKDL